MSIASYQSKLKSAESSLSFVQSEHKKVLNGLHEEIARLQQKCADLQFSLTTSQASAKAETELKSQLQSVQEQNVAKEELLAEARARLERQDIRIQELEEQSKWKELQFQNELEGKDRKIQQLQNNLAKQSVVGKLQGEIKQLYQERDSEVQAKMVEVVRRARHSPSSSSSPRDSASNDQESRTTTTVPSPTSTRAKVFRHRLQKTLNTTNVVDKFNFDDMVVYRVQDKEAVLPSDYRDKVATLPPILSRSNSITGTPAAPAAAQAKKMAVRDAENNRTDSFA